MAQIYRAAGKAETAVANGQWSDNNLRTILSAPVIVNDGSAARQRFASAFDEFRALFPIVLCYSKIVPVDEVVTLRLFYREDEQLRRLLLDEREAAELFALPAGKSAKRIVVAMSGGVDSSVVAGIAARSGAEVIGVTLQLYDYGAATGRKGACCAGDDIRDARAVADRLGIAHYVFDHESRFHEDVVDRFADDYLAGRTPIPCIRCNMGPKFTDLFRMAREFGADCLATGHYVRRVIGPAGAELHRALDPARDQSYFLYGTTEAQLDFLRFPLGGLPKSQVRAIAEAEGLRVAAKPDSEGPSPPPPQAASKPRTAAPMAMKR